MNQTNPSFWQTNVGKTVVTIVYLAVSAALGGLVAATSNDPSLFGPATGLINVALVFIVKTWFSTTTPNLGNK